MVLKDCEEIINKFGFNILNLNTQAIGFYGTYKNHEINGIFNLKSNEITYNVKNNKIKGILINPTKESLIDLLTTNNF